MLDKDEVMLHIVLTQYIGMKCSECGHKYTSIDDLKEKKVVRGYGEKFNINCEKCFLEIGLEKEDRNK